MKTHWNDEKRFQGQRDSELIKKSQLINSIKKFETFNFTKIYSSPLKRAHETSNIIATELNLKVEIIEGLTEINLGVWEGQLEKEVENKCKNQFYNFYHKQNEFKVSNSETFMDVEKRAVSAVKKIIDINEADDKILFVSHGIVIKLILNHFTNVPIQQFSSTPYISNSVMGISKLSLNNGMIDKVVYFEEI